MEDRVIELLKTVKMKKSLSFEQIAEALEINNKEGLLELKDILDKKTEENEVFLTPSNTYKHMSKTSYRRGVFHANRAGGGKVLVVTSYEKDGEHIVLQKEYTVKAGDANGAINNDEVLIDIDLKDSNNVKATVYKVIGRNLSNVYGRIQVDGSSIFVVPIDKTLKNLKILVEGNYLEGQLVEVRLDRQTANDFYLGTVVRTSNFKDDPKEDILMEAFMNGIDDKFSDQSLEQLKRIPDKVLPSDFIGRQDLRDTETFTIDGIDTNDIDDAVSCKILPNGNYELTVSIADVSHYVPFNSPLDLDARRKGNSTYLAGTVIPMFPRKLSSGICSLFPKVDRCTKSIRMEIDKNGNVVRKDLFRSIINSNIKMNYDTVNNILYDRYNGEDFPEDYKKHEETLKNMYKLSLILRKKRIENGAVEFNKPEMKIKLDDNGKTIKIEKRVQDIAENLIEEFMIVANVSVFRLLHEKGIPTGFRVHDKPSLDRLMDFFNMLNILGIPFTKYSAQECVDDRMKMQELANYINDDCPPHLKPMLTNKLVRCLSRAKYSVINIGHDGLGERIYGHFTSDIRRYFDFSHHHIIDDCYFNKKNSEKNKEKWRNILPEICYQVTKTEVNSDNTERSIESMKSAEYMNDYRKEEFVGTVIDVCGSGLIVQLDNLVEGRVKYSSLDGNYLCNPETYSIISLDGKEDYFIGDQLKVKVKGVDKEKKTIDFKIIEKLIDNSNKNLKRENELAIVKKKQKEIERQERKRKYSELKG